MKYVAMKSIEDLTKEYNNSITRSEFLAKCVPAMLAALDGMKSKSFDIRNVQALADAIKSSTGTDEVYARKGTGWSGETFYSIHAKIPGTNEREEFSTQYGRNDSPSQADRLRDVLNRYSDASKWADETRVKLAALETRHKRASELLEQIKEYSDLIS